MMLPTALHGALSILLAATIALTGAPVQAQGPTGEDIVNLKNGGMVRGKILELVPDESVTIESAATGEKRTYPWSDVAGVERGDQAGGPPAVEAPPPARPRGQQFHIELTRDAPVQLFEIVGETVATGVVSGGGTAIIHGITYRPVCRAPCDQPVDGSAGQPFFFGGDGITGSKRFTLTEHGGDVIAKVRPGRRGLRVGGMITLSLGLSTSLIGAILFPIANIGNDPQYDMNGLPIPGTEPRPNYLPATLVLVGGLALLGGGIAMFVLGRTKFSLESRGIGLGKRARLHVGAGLTARF